MTDLVKIALITSIPPLVSSFIWGWANHRKIAVVETQTNNMNTELRQQRNAATTRADSAEGQIKGVAAEQERTKDKP